MIIKSLRIFICFLTFPVFSQEIPPIQNFTSIDYGGSNQNWEITQTKNKHIYAANNSGFLAYNGITWKMYPSPNGSELRSVKAIGNKVYSGCYMEFGYWEKDEYGNMKYSSLLNKLKTPLIEDEQFWNILEFNDYVLFQSLQRIYIYNTIDESIDIIDSESTKAHIFKINNSIYFQKINQGIYKIENGKGVLVSKHFIVQENNIVGVFSYKDTILFLTDKGGFYFLEGENLIKWEIPADKELASVNVYSSLKLKDGSFILGTISHGIYRLDSNGLIIQRINQKKGLNSNTILSLFEDTENNLWLGLNNGISVINLSSPFQEYLDNTGKVGVVYASIIFNEYLYLGTNQGVLYKKNNTDEEFKLIENTNGQVWFLKKIHNTLFCGHNNGTFVIEKAKAILIADFPGTWDIKPITNNKNILLQGNYNGLSVLEKTNGKWFFRNKIKGLDISSRFFEFLSPHKIIINNEFKGIFKVELDTQYNSITNIKKEDSKGRGASLVTYGNEIVYKTNEDVFIFNKSLQHFTKDTLLTNIFFKDNKEPEGILISDAKTKRLWSFAKNNILYVSPSKVKNSSRINKISIPSSFRISMGELGFECITPLKENLYLIGISDGYITLDLDKLQSKEYRISINSIANKSNDANENKVLLKEDNEFKHTENNISFYYSVPEFDKYTEVNYQYKLDGIYNEWSNWEKTPEVSFKNLSFGEYIFSVRAKVGNNLTENIATHTFVINRPWYLSNVAIFIYVLGFLLILYTINKLYKTYYKRQQEQLLKENKKKLRRKKLKAQKKIVQIKNEKLRDEIESKNRELAISTMSIIKKNEFLNAIKGQLKESENNNQIKSVIRTIDRNINNEDDWKLFEDAFNNADKDFLKKIKRIHPELTSNDLRLCAYLRLNLSSKEIAPLLNISVRSVEVKRYRLRKKMNLIHENSLTDYILNL